MSSNAEEPNEAVKKPINQPLNQNLPVIWLWKKIAMYIFLHLGGLYGIYCIFYNECKWKTLLFTFILHICAHLGIMAGIHRLWSHRAYKARLPLRILLCVFQTLSGQHSIFVWARDHRVHHKYSETHADPHNAKRGMFFAHIGWLLQKKHPDVIEKGSKIPLNDLLDDPVVFYQNKFYAPLVILAVLILPTYIPMSFWDESFKNAFFISAILRYIFTLHLTFLVNSVAHMWGYKPYDKHINPVENEIVSFLSLGEGFHNYHHSFPQDYAASEYGSFYFNFAKFFIDLMAFIGLAYDRRTITPEMIEQRRKRTGDFSNSYVYQENFEHEY